MKHQTHHESWPTCHWPFWHSRNIHRVGHFMNNFRWRWIGLPRIILQIHFSLCTETGLNFSMFVVSCCCCRCHENEKEKKWAGFLIQPFVSVKFFSFFERQWRLRSSRFDPPAPDLSQNSPPSVFREKLSNVMLLLLFLGRAGGRMYVHLGVSL